MVSGLTDDNKPRERDLNKYSGKDEPQLNTQDIVNFLDVMNNQTAKPEMDECRKFTARQWAKHWDRGTAPTSCYLYNDEAKEQYAHYKHNACGLNQALNQAPPSPEDVDTAVKRILGSGPEGIRRNFNHLMNLVVQNKYKEPKPEWYGTIKNSLQQSDSLRDVLKDVLTTDPHIGFKKKADYLYFYKQVYGDSTNEDDVKRHQQISTAFLDHLNQAYEQIPSIVDSTKGGKKLSSLDKAILVSEYHRSIRAGIDNNGDDELAGWLYSYQEKIKGQDNKFDDLIKKYKTPSNYLPYKISEENVEALKNKYSGLADSLCKSLSKSEILQRERVRPTSDIYT